MPRRIAIEAAKEKFSTAVIEMTVEAKQRFNAFSTTDSDASDGEAGGIKIACIGRIAVMSMTATGQIC